MTAVTDGDAAPIRLADMHPFRLGPLEVDPPHRLLRRDDGTVEAIEPRVMQVLALLAAAPGRVVSRSTLNARCWGGRAVSDDAIDRVIGKIRRLARGIGGDGFAIVTVPRIGFSLKEQAPGAGGERPTADAATLVPDGRSEKPPVLSRRLLLGGTAVAATAGAALWSMASWRKQGSAGGVPPRVAVLPFENLSPGSVSGFAAAALARQVRGQLSRVGGLRVIAEPSSRAVLDHGFPDQEIGARLGVRWIVRGSVLEADGRLRVEASLADAANGVIVWSTVQDGMPADLFPLQDAVAGQVLRELIGRAGPMIERPPAQPPHDSRVFRLVLRGQDLFEQSRAARMEKRPDHAFDTADEAFALARRALAIDANDPGALLLVAQLTRNGWTRAMAAMPLSPEQRVQASILFVTRALAADPNDPAALTALGDYYRRFEWRFAEAESLFRRALAISPSSIETHWSYAYMLGTTGRALEGLAHAETVFRLDPQTTWRRVALPRLLYLVGDRAAAYRRYAVELAETPDNLFLIGEIYLVHLSEGDADALERLAADVRRLNGAAALSSKLAEQVGRIGDAVAALGGKPRALLARIDADVRAFDAPQSSVGTRQARAGIDLLYIAAVEYAWAGATERALVLLERALAGKSLYWPATLPYGNAPLPAALRHHPRYVALWRSGPGPIDVARLRRRGLLAGQMAGYLPDGRYSRPGFAAVRASLGGA